MTKYLLLISSAVISASAVFLTLPNELAVRCSNEATCTTNRVSLPDTESDDAPQSPLAVGHPTFASPHFHPIAILGDTVFVVNTPDDTVDVIDSKNNQVEKRIPVGVDPVCIVARPDGKELWVSNHVSDSINVIDSDPRSPFYLHVIATIQEFDSRTRATKFDEPVGIAFANNDKAYVALSSENQIAIVDAQSHRVTGRLRIPAQDPRAIVVHQDRLFVIPFESNNKTQLSGGRRDDIDGELVTFDAWEHSIRVNNVLSIGHVTDIVKHPDVPDRDLFVFDTKSDKLIETADSLGTLLYGMAVDSNGNIYIAQTDARNDVNGKSGTKKHGLAELENRAFLNQITKVEFKNGKPQSPEFINLEPLPPAQPNPGTALATPYGIEVSQDKSALIVTAAGSNKLFTLDSSTGKVLGSVKVGVVPRGVKLENNQDGKPTQAWVYNAVGNTVCRVDLSDLKQPKVVGTVELNDPTHPKVKLGRAWFNDAEASTTGTFSCASCHPDGHTDQLLWVLKTPVVTGGNQIMPRSTMPIRGLRDTAPFHWDGIPGDPYGGNNSANVHGRTKPNSNIDDPASTTRHLIDGGLASTMHLDGDSSVNDEGKVGKLTAAQRDEMALFLLSLPYPPAQRRAFDNVLSEKAQEGFRLFHIDGDNDPSRDRPNVCGNCHRMPFLVSTNTPGTGMDAPTWRGAYDRFLILPQGRLNIIEFPFYRSVAERGQSEEEIWRFSWGGRRRFNPIWNMVVEGSTGFSGSFARQVTINQDTRDEKLSTELLNALEASARDQAIILEVDGALLEGKRFETVSFQFDPRYQGGAYVAKSGKRDSYTRKKLIALAAEGKFVGTFTARHGENADIESPQPALWTTGPIHTQRGRQRFPILYAGNQTMTVSGRHFKDDVNVFVNGSRAEAEVEVKNDNQERVSISLATLPKPGMHLLQVQTKNGQFSNDFIFHVTKNADGSRELQRELDRPHTGSRDALVRSIESGDLERVKKRLARVKKLDARRGDGGSTLLSTAALHGHLDVARYLIEKGAKVNATNRDGNTPLHTAAFLCRTEFVELLLKHDASVTQKNDRGESPIQVVSGPWNEGLARFYSGLATAVGIELELDTIKRLRPEMAKRLREIRAKTKN